MSIFRDLKSGGGGGGGGASAAARPRKNLPFSLQFHLNRLVYLAESNTGANPRGLSPSKPPAAPVQMPQVPSSYGAASAYDQGSGSNQSKSSSNLPNQSFLF